MASVSANENSALRRDASASPVAEDDYQSFCEALGASERGRAFLAEYARRNRHADTEVVLEALGRLEETARNQKPPAADGDRIRQDLRALLDTLRTAKPQTENSPSAIKAATLSALIDFTQARLEALVTMPDDLRALEALAAVPVPEQPELPIPRPVAAAPAPTVVLTQPPLRVAEVPIVDKIASSAPPAALADADAFGIPRVEFDYEAQQAGRPAVAPKAKSPVEPVPAWSELSPPTVATAKIEAKVEVRAETKLEPKLEPKTEATLEAIFEPKFESWPAVLIEDIVPPSAPPEAKFATKPDVKAEAKPEAKVEAKLAPASQSEGQSGRVAHAGEVETYELWLDDLTVEPTETIAAETNAAETIVAETMAPSVTPQPPSPPVMQVTPGPAASGLTATAIEALVEQLQRPTPPGAAPATIGKVEVADPLAPILALSEDERLALFT